MLPPHPHGNHRTRRGLPPLYLATSTPTIQYVDRYLARTPRPPNNSKLQLRTYKYPRQESRGKDNPKRHQNNYIRAHDRKMVPDVHHRSADFRAYPHVRLPRVGRREYAPLKLRLKSDAFTIN